MTLYLEAPANTFSPWAGAAIDDIRHPLNIEQLWSDDELAAVGLYRPAAAGPVPTGKVVLSTSVQRVDGIVTFVYALEDAPPPSIPEISDRQFFQALAVRGDITEQEALDAVGPGIIPPAMDALIDHLPQEQRFPARMLIRGATRYERLHPIADLIRGLYGWTEEQADDFWRFAATL